MVEETTSLLKVLLATHSSEHYFAKSIVRTLRGYQVEVASTIEEALFLCGQYRYGWYILEANLGSPATNNISSLQQIYSFLQEQGIAGLEQKVVSFSGTLSALEAAEREGIKAVDTLRLAGYLHSKYVKYTKNP